MAKPTDYRDTPYHRPWSRDLDVGDQVTIGQAKAIDATRLRDFGLILAPSPDSGFTVVALREAD